MDQIKLLLPHTHTLPVSYEKFSNRRNAIVFSWIQFEYSTATMMHIVNKSMLEFQLTTSFNYDPHLMISHLWWYSSLHRLFYRSEYQGICRFKYHSKTYSLHYIDKILFLVELHSSKLKYPGSITGNSVWKSIFIMHVTSHSLEGEAFII